MRSDGSQRKRQLTFWMSFIVGSCMEQRVDDYLPRWVMLKDFFMKGKVTRFTPAVPLVQKKMLSGY
jgi:hypothetical protein